jgi:hypothetical protein
VLRVRTAEELREYVGLGDTDVDKDCRTLALVVVVIVTKPFVGLVDHERLTLPRSDLLTELVNVLTAVPVRNRLVPETVIVI